MCGRARPDPVALAIFCVVIVLGSSNFIAVRFSNLELPPFWGAGLRFALASVLFLGLVAVLRLRLPRGRILARTVVWGALNFGVVFALSYWSLQFVTAGAATVVMATVPLATLLLAAAQGLERVRVRGLVGGLLALAGITWMSFGPGGIDVPLPALVALLVATVCIAQSIILAKGLSGNDPMPTNAVGMASGALVLLALSFVAGEPWSWPDRPETLAAVAYMVVFGSVTLFVLVLLLMRRWTASAASYTIVLFPVVTPALEYLLAGVPVTPSLLVGAAVVVLGVWFGALAPGRDVPAGEASRVAKRGG